MADQRKLGEASSLFHKWGPLLGVAGVGSLALVAIVLVQSAPASTKQGNAAASVERELEQLREELTRLKAAQASQRLELAAARQGVPLNHEEADSSAADPAEPPPADAPERPSSEVIYRDLEEKFAAESVDTSWARSRESEMTTLALNVPGVRAKSVACRASMCRLETEFETREAREDFERAFTTAEVNLGKHIWGHRASSEHAESTVFLVSRDESLPTLRAAENPSAVN